MNPSASACDLGSQAPPAAYANTKAEVAAAALPNPGPDPKHAAEAGIMPPTPNPGPCPAPQPLPLPDRADHCCQICLELLFDPIITECQHRFCAVCIADWRGTGSKTCPTCRQSLAGTRTGAVDGPMLATLKLHFAAEYATLERTAGARAANRAAKIEARREADRTRQLSINRVKGHFAEGHRMDDEAVAVLLDMFGGDITETMNFLSADHAPVGEAVLVSLAEADSGSLRIPRDFYSGIADQPPVELPAPAPGSARDIATVLLSATSTYSDHLRIQKEHRQACIDCIAFLIERSVLPTMTAGAKARCLACCWARRDTELSSMLLSTGLLDPNDTRPDVFGIPEVLKAMRLLDSGRVVRASRKRLAKLEAQGSCKRATLGKLRSDIDNLEREQVSEGSLSGSLAKYIRKVVARIPVAKLEYYALQMPTGPWREMADLLHLNPGTGTRCNWFMQFAHGADAPGGSIVDTAARLAETADGAGTGAGGPSAADLLSTARLPYSVVRKALPMLSAAHKRVVAGYMPLDQLLWWYEELQLADELDGIILGKLTGGERPSLAYGKMMERLMLFDRLGRKVLFEALLPFAEEQLREIRLDLERPVAVLGDASFSMDVAIRTATILSSLMAVISDAELSFFHSEVARPERVPDTAASCVEVATKTKTLGQTAPAAALWEYYAAKKVIKCFVVVSDEGENVKSNGYYFHELFRKYHDEVHPAKLVFVSFLDANEQGQMATAIERMGFGPLKFSFDRGRPDLTKLDALLGTLAVAEL